MRRLLCLLAGILLGQGVINAAIIATEDFNDSTVIFTSSDGLFHDGTSDYFSVVPGIIPTPGAPANPVTAYTGFAGGFFAAEDIDDGGTRPGVQTLTFTVNVSNFENLTFDGDFALGGNGAAFPAYDSNDGLLVRAQIDGGAFQNLLSFEAIGTTNQVARVDADFDGTGDAAGFQPTSAATAFNGLAIAGTGNVLTLEVVVASNDGNAEFAFDNFVFNGDLTAVPEPSSMALVFAGMAFVGFRRRR